MQKRITSLKTGQDAKTLQELLELVFPRRESQSPRSRPLVPLREEPPQCNQDTNMTVIQTAIASMMIATTSPPITISVGSLSLERKPISG